MTLTEEAIDRLSPTYYAEAEIDPAVDETVRAALRADLPHYVAAGFDDGAVERCVATLFHFAPLLMKLQRPLQDMVALEVGAGVGARALGLSQLFARYLGAEINANLAEWGRANAKIFGRDNLSFHTGNAVDLLRDPRSIGLAERPDVIILHAVVEHLTLPERQAVLAACRESLEAGAALLVAETPNRLIRFDSHSSRLPFFQMLPPELALAYADRSPRLDWRREVFGGGDPPLGLHRAGVAASYHEFDLWLWGGAEQRVSILCDGWSPHLLHHEPVSRDELGLADYFQANDVPAHRAFARSWIEMLLTLDGPPHPAAAPRLLPATELVQGSFTPARAFWSSDTYALQGREAFARHAAPSDAGPPRTVVLTVALDDPRSRGAFTVETETGTVLRTVDIQEAASRRPPKWHALAPITIDPGAHRTFIVRPLDAASGVVYRGLLAL